MKLQGFKVLSDREIVGIHESSLRLLAETGMVVHSRKAMDLLAEAGAEVDIPAKRVRFPARLVEGCLQSVPARITLCNRNGEPALTLGDGEPHVASGHNAIYVLDMETGERRSATRADIGQFALLSDALPNIHVVGVQAMPLDVPAQSSLIHAVDAAINNTEKHIYWSPDTDKVTRPILEIGKAVAGVENLAEKPIMTCQVSPTSPLIWEEGAADALFEVVEAGVPLSILPEPFCGVTAPITLAGILTQQNAEVLSGIVLSQLVRKGAPVIRGHAWTTFDMRAGNVTIGSPEAALLRIAGAQMAKYYNMPCHSISPDTDAHCHDEQTAWEKVFTSMGALAGGVDLIVNCGMFSTGLIVSFEQLVLDNEMMGILLRMMRGITVNPDTIALDVVESVGPHGNFLMEEHTMKYLRSGEHWEPDISNRCVFDRWVQDGRKDIVIRAREKAREILANHSVHPLDRSVTDRIASIISGFEG